MREIEKEREKKRESLKIFDLKPFRKRIFVSYIDNVLLNEFILKL